MWRLWAPTREVHLHPDSTRDVENTAPRLQWGLHKVAGWVADVAHSRIAKMEHFGKQNHIEAAAQPFPILCIKVSRV